MSPPELALAAPDPAVPGALSLRFAVDPASRARLAAEMARGDGRRLPMQRQAAAAAAGDAAAADAVWRRQVRHLRTGAAVVALCFDELRLTAAPARLQLRQLTLVLQSGPPTDFMALAERWRRRFGLVLEPRRFDERAARLAQGLPQAPPRRALRPAYARRAPAGDALGAVLDECLDQILRNAAGLNDGHPGSRADQVHQLRVGLRRLRTALRSFAGCVAAPPSELDTGLRALFDALGRVRDDDVLGLGLAADLARAGAPPLRVPGRAPGALGDAAAIVRAPATQQCLLACLAWRAGLVQQPSDGDVDLRRHALRRLRRWHARIVADAALFELLDTPAVHALRKRVKRQRYATEFFAPVLPRRAVERYLAALSEVQARMGTLNDLHVARARYQALVDSDAAAWFALGWLAARIADARAAVQPGLRALARLQPPGA